MTAIAGLEHDGKVWIGADSAGTDPDTWSQAIRAEEKVFRINEFLFGCAGSIRCANLVRYRMEPPIHPEGMPDHEYLCTSLIDAVRIALESGGALRKSDDTGNVEELDANFLLGYRGKLYVIECDFQVGSSVDGFMSVGCGQDLVLGALAVSTGKPQTRITNALKAAERFSAGVRGPFKIMTL